MTPTASAWSKGTSTKTMRRLTADYPGYTVNELYAIWCHENGKIPLDDRGKVDTDTWQMHATEDGEHVQDGGFKVSRALYGRATRAQRGRPKPARAKARPTESVAESNGRSNDLSPMALQFAQEYDSTARVIDRIIRMRREIDDLLVELKGVRPPVATGLADASTEAKTILKEAGAV